MDNSIAFETLNVRSGVANPVPLEGLDIYEAQEFKIAVNQNVIETAHRDGKIEGATSKAIEIAKTMLAKGFDIATIADITTLTPKEIENLK
ncbi:MAG: hypothetical protein QX191_03385 [Methylococcaceae bacterium]